MHTADPAHPEQVSGTCDRTCPRGQSHVLFVQVLRLLVQTGAPCEMWRVDAAEGAGAAAAREVKRPQTRLVMLRWLRSPRPPGPAGGMDSPPMCLGDALAMNDRLVREHAFQRRKWILFGRERFMKAGSWFPGSAGAGAACTGGAGLDPPEPPFVAGRQLSPSHATAVPTRAEQVDPHSSASEPQLAVVRVLVDSNESMDLD